MTVPVGVPDFAPINATESPTTIIPNISAGSGGLRSIVVYGWQLIRGDDNSGATNYTFKDSTGATLWGPMNTLTQGNGNAMGEATMGWFFTAPGADLILTADQAGAVGGGVSYFYR